MPPNYPPGGGRGVGKDVSEGYVKRADDGPSVVGGTHLGNVKGSDDGTSVVGITQRDMSYAEVVSKRLTNNKTMIRKKSHSVEIIQVKALYYGHPLSSNLTFSIYYIICGLRIPKVYTILGL